MPESARYDALLVVSFGGPESREDVIPFLENVLQGRNVPAARLREVAEHYYQFGGRSPINDQVRDLIGRLRPELHEHGIDLPIYWGNRNWHPLLPDTLKKMQQEGVQRALALVLSSYASYSGCRQYRENLQAAQTLTGAGAPRIDKIRLWYNHPDFIAANADALHRALAQTPHDAPAVAFTAHSIPSSMAAGCDYEQQLRESCRLVTEAIGVPPERWQLVYQSRSGRPSDPWLGPDINEHLADLARHGCRSVAVMPIGFLSDHLEVLYDLDEEAQQTAAEVGLAMVRGDTIAGDGRFVAMLRELIAERLGRTDRCRAIGRFPPAGDQCRADCCPIATNRPPASPA